MESKNGGGSTTETDSDAENAAHTANRSFSMRRKVSTTSETTQVKPVVARTLTPPLRVPPWIAPNSVLAVPPGPPTPPSVEYAEITLNAPAVGGHSASPVASEPPTRALDEPAQDEDALFCGLCTLRFTSKAVSKSRRKNAGEILSCACCRRGGLVERHFSKAQRHKPAHEQRCLTCCQGGDEALKIVRGKSKFTRKQLIEKNKKAIELKLEASAKRREKLAKTKLEKQQREAARLHEHGSDGEEEPEEAPAIEVDEVEARQRMEKALRDILQDYRSIERRRGVNDLDGPYREQYELQLLEEESKLHEKAVQLRLANVALYDEVCDMLTVVDGKVKLGERDHEQGEYDGDKPNHRITKDGKVKIIKRKPPGNGNVSGEDLLLAAKATAECLRSARGSDGSTQEPPAKRVKRTDQDGVAWMVLNRQLRRASRPTTYNV